jgi:hypothetical protein
MLLSEFPQQVIDSHALIVAGILGGETPSTDILIQLAAEILTIDKLTVLAARQARTIKAAHDVWMAAHECFHASLDLWHRLPHDDCLAGHERLLQRLVCSASERLQFYTVSDYDRRVHNSQRDHGLPLPYAETQ